MTVRRRGYSWGKEQETASPEPGAIPVVRIPNIRDRLDRSDILYLRRVSAEDLATFAVEQDWILFVASNGNPDRIGDSVLITADEEMLFASFLQGITSRDRGRLRPSFLSRWMRLNSVHQTFSKTSQQTTGLANFSWGAVKNLPVRYPENADEQDTIAEVLDDADRVVHDTRDLTSALRLKQGMLDELLTHGLRGRHDALHRSRWLTCPQPWKRRRLRRLATIDSGFTMGRDLRGVETVTLPYVTVVNVQDGRFDLTTVSTAVIKSSEIDDAVLAVGDVLLTEGGDRDKLGRGALWEGAVDPCVYQNHIFRIRIDDSEYRQKLFHYLLQARQTRRYFASRAKQTSNLCTINSRDVAQLVVGVPDPDEQDEIVRQLEAVDQLIASLQERHSAATRLRTALLEAIVGGSTRVDALART